MTFYEEASGARMHAAFIRPGGVAQDISPITLQRIYDFTILFSSHLDYMEEILNNNTI